MQLGAAENNEWKEDRMRDNESKSEVKHLARICLLASSLFLSIILFERNVESFQKPFGNVDWILVIDTSKSMRGAAPSAQNVFEDVKDQVKQFIHMAGDDDSIAIYTFAEKPELIRSVF